MNGDIPPGYVPPDTMKTPGLSSSQFMTSSILYGFRFSANVFTVEKVVEWLSRNNYPSTHVYKVSSYIYGFVGDTLDVQLSSSYGIGIGVDMLIGTITRL